MLEALKHRGEISYPEDIFDRVRTQIPNMDIHRLKIAMNGYVSAGTLTKTEMGQYIIPSETTKAIVNASGFDEDMLVIEEALTALAKLEAVIKKHQMIASQFGTLKQALMGIKTENVI